MTSEEKRLTQCEFCTTIFDVTDRPREERHDAPRYGCPNCQELTYGPVSEYVD